MAKSGQGAVQGALRGAVQGAVRGAVQGAVQTAVAKSGKGGVQGGAQWQRGCAGRRARCCAVLNMVRWRSLTGNYHFRPLGTGVGLQLQSMVPNLGTSSSYLWEPALACNGNPIYRLSQKITF